MVLLLPSLGLTRYELRSASSELFFQCSQMKNYFSFLSFLCSLDVFFRWVFDKKFFADAKVRFE